MSRWQPEKYSSDPMVNAVLNVAASLSALAEATDGLLYGLKHSKGEGMSIAEAVEVGARAIATRLDALEDVGGPVEIKQMDSLVEIAGEVSDSLGRIERMGE